MKERIFLDIERDEFITETMLRDEYENGIDFLKDDIKARFPSFERWLDEISGKNGSLELYAIKRDISEKELIKLREEIPVGSLFIADYRNSFDLDPRAVCDFFDSYLDYLEELMNDDGIKDDDFWKRFPEYDNDDNLIAWLYCFDECPLKIIDDV